MAGTARWRVFGVLVAIAVLAAACGNSGDDGGAAPETTAGDGSTPSTDGEGSEVTTGGDVATSTGDFTEHVPVDAPGVTDDEIRVGSITAKTNPLGGDNVLLNEGVKGYFDVVNSQGGIYGRELKLTSERDDAFVNNATETEALLSLDDVYAVFIATTLFTGASALADAGIPTFGWNINADWAGPETFFPNIAPVCFEGCALLPHVTPWLMREVGAHRAAVIGYSVPQSASCVEGTAANIEQLGPAVDAEVVYTDSALAFGQLDFSAQVAKMREEEVDFLVTCTDFNADFLIAREMNLQGIREDVVFYHPNLYNPSFARDNADVLEGDIVLAQITAVEHPSPPPALQEYLDYAAEHDLEVTEMTMQGWIAARQLVDALKATGPDFAWEHLVDTWNQQTWYTAGGWVPPIDWTRQHHDPGEGPEFRSALECGNFVRVRDGEFVSFGAQGADPWVCFDGRRPDEWHEPINVSFAGEPFDVAEVLG